MKYNYRSRRLKPVHRQNRLLYQAAFEQLEERRLMSLLGISPGYPQLVTNQTGNVNYTYSASSATGTFDLSSNPFSFQATNGGATHSVLTPDSFTIQFQTDGNGNVVGGVVGADFSVTGTIDMNNDFKADAGDISGTLLTGEISQFGYLNNGTIDQYDFTFTPTGGLLIADYPTQFAGMDIGVTMSSENSTFNGNFTQNFTGKVKAVAGPVPAPVNSPPIGSIAGTKYQDLTGNGFSADDTPLSGVTIDLYQDSNANGVLDASDTFIGSQTTDTNGNYIFGGLSAGTYFAEESVPAGQTETGSPQVWTIALAANQAVSNIDFDDFVNVSISGTKYQDATGNSFSSDDQPLSGVTIDLYQNGGATPVEQTTTDSNGDYSFNNLGPGSYFVQEENPAGWIETGGAAGYTINAISGSNYTGNNFDDYQIETPTLVTTANFGGGSNTVGTAIPQDSAVLSGGNQESGNLVFTLTAPDGTTADSQTLAANGNGIYATSDTNVATQVGTYTWHVTYAGDTLNNGTIDQGGSAEQVLTVQANPSINTQASESNGGIVGSAMLADVATLSGGYNPTGAITFTLTQPDGSTIFEGVVTASGDNAYNSPSVLATEVGNYTWHAAYSGDTNNSGATDNGANEGVAVSAATPAITTQATVSNGGIVGSAMLMDVATLSGGYSPTGTITFTLTQPDGSTISEGSDTVAGDNTYNSPSVLATEVGTYTWHASYSGDTNNVGASDNGANEGVTTTKASPAINTVGSETNGGIVGSAILSDSATLSGGYNITGGSITFSLTAPDGSTTTIGTVPVTSAGTYPSTGVLATEVGTYTWHATYSGDGLNVAATDNGVNEAVTTTQASPAINTAATVSNGGIVGSAMLADVATLSGGYNPTGTITFTLTQPDGSTIPEGSVTAAGDNTYNSPSVLATEVGSYMWHATYSGDTNNTGAADNGVDEGVATTKASPAITTSATESNGGIVGNSMLCDSATITGGYNVGGGSITFTLTAPDGTTSTVGTVSVTAAGTYKSSMVAATEVGTYTWHASYSGDTLNNGAIDNGVNESVTTTKSTPAINTQASESNGGIVGSAILSDSATLSGGFTPTGTINFSLTQPDGNTISEGSVAVTGDNTYPSPTVLATEVGTYTWHASYGGDANNASANDSGANEGVITTKSSPTVVTSASFKTSTCTVVGQAIPEDSAVVSGGYLPAGTITFTLKAPGGSVVDTQTINVAGDGTYNTTNTSVATVVGTYTWSVSYSGDINNNTASDQGGSAEQVITTKSSPAVVTTASTKVGTGNTVGTAIPEDSAIVSAGYNPTGSLVFTLKGPTGSTVSTQTVAITGDGTYTTSNAAVATAIGTYTWSVSYAGDSSNNSATDQGGAAEQITIIKASPAVVTSASFKTSACTVGAAIPEDSAVVSGGDSPTGNLVFTLKAPNGTVADTQTIVITGDGTYATTNTAVATQIGTYTWTVSYNGDTSNNSASDQGGSAEQVTVTKATPTITTTASFKTGCGNLIGSGVPEDSAVVAGGDVPSGSLTFTLTAPNGSVVDTQVVNITGDGTYATSNTTAATQAGTYTWAVTYNGNTLNNSAKDQGGAAEQLVIASGSISGTKYNDVTGNGFSSDDTPLSGVTIELFKSGSSTVLASAVTDSNGNYSFTGLAAGSYVVEEVVPTGWVQTAPVAGSYNVTLSTSSLTSTSNNFDDFMSSCCNTADFTNVCFVVQDAGGVKTVSDLRGNTNQGDEVTAFFDYTGSSPHPVTFVTYTAPDNYWNADDASEQQEFQVVTIMAQPGENSITVQIPNCDYQIDLVCGYAIDQLGPNGSNITYSSQSRLISADNDGCEAQASSFGQVNGTVYLDLDNDGKQDANEAGIAGVTVLLTGKDSHGDAVSLLRVTDSNGDYSFQGLQPGTYSVKEISPAGFLDGKDTLGTGAGGTMSNDLFSNLKVVASTDGENYNFGELPAKACSGVTGCVATCTFWNGTNGKNLICSFGSGANDCSLGNWLAATCPNIYGSACGSNCLAGKTNSQVYTYLQTLYKNSSSKTACEVLAACLNVYAADASLGGLCGAAYGFSVQCDGAACTTYSVGTNGSCFGVSNNTKCSLSDLIDACNAKSSKGSLFGGNTTNSNNCYTVLSGINGW